MTGGAFAFRGSARLKCSQQRVFCARLRLANKKRPYESVSSEGFTARRSPGKTTRTASCMILLWRLMLTIALWLPGRWPDEGAWGGPFDRGAQPMRRFIAPRPLRAYATLFFVSLRVRLDVFFPRAVLSIRSPPKGSSYVLARASLFLFLG